MSSEYAPSKKEFRTEAQLDELATKFFHQNPECDVLCRKINAAENALDMLMESPDATDADKADVIALIRALTRQRTSLHCPLPCIRS